MDVTRSYHFQEVHRFGRQTEVRLPTRHFTGRLPSLAALGEEGEQVLPADDTGHPDRTVNQRPPLHRYLEAGRTLEEWLSGRIPGVDYARISADQSTRSAVQALGREAGTGIRHQHEENIETAAQPTVVRPAFTEVVDALHCRMTTEGFPVRALIATEHERVWRLASDFSRVHQAVTITEEGLFIERQSVFGLHSKHGAEEAVASDGEVWRTKERIERHIRRRAIDGGTPGGRRRFGRLPPDPRSGLRINMREDPKSGLCSKR